jgi:hypothetical protein
MIQQAPDIPVLDTGGGTPPLEPPAEGDHRPDRDWALIGVLAFGLAFSAVSALRFGAQLMRELV